MDAGLIVAVVLVLLVIVVVIKTAVVVPQQSAYIVENLGRYSRTLTAGFHLLIPFLDRVAYKHTLKEQAIDVEEQICITSDNVQVGVDGVLYMQVMDARNASYGIGDYLFAIAQLAQTTLRSEIGRIELDKTFEERNHINLRVVEELDQASDPWGVKVLRYEIKNINPPADVVSAMEKQMRAEREKRATVLQSEGDRDAKVNEAEGEKRGSSRNRKRPSSSRSTRPRARRRPSWRSRRPRLRGCGRLPRHLPATAVTRPCSFVLPRTTLSASATSPRKAIR